MKTKYRWPKYSNCQKKEDILENISVYGILKSVLCLNLLELNIQRKNQFFVAAGLEKKYLKM